MIINDLGATTDSRVSLDGQKARTHNAGVEGSIPSLFTKFNLMAPANHRKRLRTVRLSK